jgi:hypothetical protein
MEWRRPAHGKNSQSSLTGSLGTRDNSRTDFLSRSLVLDAGKRTLILKLQRDLDPFGRGFFLTYFVIFFTK